MSFQLDRRGRREGFTLVEVLLSLGLAALVLAALATAVDVHLRCVDAGRTHVEEAQLARALLFRIADDLRNAAMVNSVDSTNVMSASSSEEGGGAATGNVGGPPDDTGDAGDTESDSESYETTTSLEDEQVLGLYGESDWMQIDVKRTPRLDQYDYETLSVGSEILLDRVSGVKTVCYFLDEETGTTSGAGEYQGGLIRREYDRSLTLMADETGTLGQVDQELEPIAPEVLDIEFRYHDGTGWVDTWDSTENGGLPALVHISLEVLPREQFDRLQEMWTEGAAAEDLNETFIYSLTVALPVAEAGTSSSDSESMEGSEETEGVE